MITPELIACDAVIGEPRVPIDGVEPGVDDLRREMARLHLAAAVVRHRACVESGPYTGNQRLLEEIDGQDGLLPAWVLTPDGCEPDFDVAGLVSRMMARGVRVAWMDPQAHAFSPLPWCAGPLYDALQAARVPLLVEYDRISADQLHEVLAAFPDLRVILLKAPRLGRNRLLYPLLAQHPELYLCFSPSFAVHEGFADLCARFGPHRWVFGTGYPEAEGGAGIAGLLYAGLPDDAVTAVAGGNIRRLLAEVRGG